MNNCVANCRVLLFLATCFWWPLTSHGQQEDAGLWTNFSLQKDFGKDFSLTLSEELRLNENMTELGTVFTEISADYKLFKGFKAGLAYRYILKRQVEDYYSKRHRIVIDLSYRYKFDRLSLSIRERFNQQYSDVYSSETGMVPVNFTRTRLRVDYEIKKSVSVFTSGEWFFEMESMDEFFYDNFRFVIGSEYAFNKRHAVEISYIINQEYNVKNELTSYIVGLAYKFTLPDKSKKKDKEEQPPVTQ
jgi:predicted porin